MKRVFRSAARWSMAAGLVLLSASSAHGNPAAQAAAAPPPQARAGAPATPPSPATVKRARKVLLDAIVKEVATRELGDCTVNQALGARIVRVERFDPATRIWPVHATAVCTGPNSIVEVPAMTFNMTRDAKGEWKAAYVKDDASN